MSMILAVAAGGAIGASGRYLLGMQMVRLFGHGFPYGTFAANVIGCFVMGFMVEIFALRFDPGQTVRAFLQVGLLGGFTTFSSFGLDVITLMNRGQTSTALLYLSLSVVLSVGAVFVGMNAAKVMMQ